ncbi:hypothetical protein ACFSJ3_18970 [Corallincola platygyrae]|uniref:Uncharacterized protein n=1 Tax=Corallincola platygyrae TaxID=1193278 RepID=A0ABW4XSC1_9GAMM
MRIIGIVCGLMLFTLQGTEAHASFSELKEDLTLFQEARDNFYYVADKANEVRIYTDIESRFAGDCEDFAYSLAMKIGGEVWFTYNAKKVPHAVVVTEYGMVFDNELEWPMRKDVYPNKLLFKIGFSHFDTVFVNGEIAKQKKVQ